MLNPRAYDNAVFEMISGTGNYVFRQNTIHGGQPIARLCSSTNACTFHDDCEIPNRYNKTYVDILIADICNDSYSTTEIDILCSNIELSNYYTKSDVDDIDNDLSTLLLNSYTKTEIDTFVHTNYTSLSFIVENFYSNTETDSTLSDYTTSAQSHNDLL